MKPAFVALVARKPASLAVPFGLSSIAVRAAPAVECCVVADDVAELTHLCLVYRFGRLIPVVAVRGRGIEPRWSLMGRALIRHSHGEARDEPRTKKVQRALHRIRERVIGLLDVPNVAVGQADENLKALHLRLVLRLGRVIPFGR